MSTLSVRRGEKLTDILFEGSPVLAHILRRHGLTIETLCSGKGVCGKCRIKVEGSLSDPTAKEWASLSPAEIASGMRLSCQAEMKGDASVSIPDVSDPMNIQLEGALPAFPVRPMNGRYGLAVDIGTTTLALRLVDLKECVLLKAATAPNPQGTIAADVIGRIEAALNGGDGRLRELVTGEIENKSYGFARAAGFPQARSVPSS